MSPPWAGRENRKNGSRESKYNQRDPPPPIFFAFFGGGGFGLSVDESDVDHPDIDIKVLEPNFTYVVVDYEGSYFPAIYQEREPQGLVHGPNPVKDLEIIMEVAGKTRQLIIWHRQGR